MVPTPPRVSFAQTPVLKDSVAKLAMAGEQAGFTVEQMIGLLQSGLTLQTLLDLIAWRLDMMVKETQCSLLSS